LRWRQRGATGKLSEEFNGMQNLFVKAYWKAIFVIMIALALGTLLSAEFNFCFDEYKKLFQREQETFLTFPKTGIFYFC
jgi:hypothetical protein